MLKEFREFIAKGNVMDLAVGIIIGSAFTAIVNSFVKDIVNPIIGLAGKANFDNMFVVLKPGPTTQLAETLGGFATPADAEKTGAVVLKYGSFLTNVLNFVIIAMVVFLMVRAVNKMRRKPETVPQAHPAQELLLAEIRDLLKARP